MSCYFVGEKRIKEIADYLYCLGRYGYDTFGYSMPETLRNELKMKNEEELYNQLAELNYKAVNFRYKREGFYISYKEIEKISSMWHQNEWGEGHYIIKQWHYDLYKALQNFVYQCDEDGNYGSKLLVGLYDLENVIARFIVANQIEYKNAAWG